MNTDRAKGVIWKSKITPEKAKQILNKNGWMFRLSKQKTFWIC
jgi:hypothetical protein